MVDDVLWTPNMNAIMISYDKDSALEIFDEKIIFAWEKYPDILKKQYKLDSDRANKLKFDFGDGDNSTILVRNKARSGTFHRIHISEFGKMCKESPSKARELISGTIPSAPLGARVDIESTAEGETGDFANMFWQAYLRGDPKTPVDFKAHFYNWTWDEEELALIDKIIQVEEMDDSARFAEYFNDLKQNYKIDLSDVEKTYYYLKWLSLAKKWNVLRQEYPTTPEEAFVGSGNKLFDTDKLKLQKQYELDGVKVGDWIYYEDFIAGHTYGLGADVAEGIGQDSSTIVIIDFTPNIPRVVAEYGNNLIAPDDFAYVIRDGARAYGNCLVAVEANNHGYTTLAFLKKMYQNIYSMVMENKKQDTPTEKLGWHTNGATKSKMIYSMNTAINNSELEIPSKHILAEMRTYDKEDISVTRFDPDQTAHWDKLMAICICWQIKNQVYKYGQIRDYTNNQGRPNYR